MKLSDLAVSRPIGTAMIYVAIVLLGMIGMRELAIDMLPSVDMPRISVTTTYEGVAPQEIETLITRPIEQNVSTIQGVDRLESTSIEGMSRVQLQFEWGTDLDSALNDVRAQLDRLRAALPEDADAPMVFKFDLSSFPVAFLGFSGNGDARELRYMAEEVISRRLEAVPGVARVDVRGGRLREVRVELSVDRLSALGITAPQVSAALARENRNVSAGDMLDSGREVVIRTEGEFATPAEVANTVVTTREGRPIHVRDVGKVVDDIQEINNELWIDGVPGIRLAISKQSDTNTVEVVRGLRREIDRLNAEYASRARITVLNDSGKFIEDSIDNVQLATLVGGGLAALILLVFLRNVRATLVVATSIPISVLATFALMFFADISLNLISFGGLALGIGMLVDNAIVMLEAIYRRRERGDDAIDSARGGAAEVAGAIISGTLTTVAVFVPVVFLGGFAGVFFTEMATVVSFALLCSLIVALTLVPSLAVRLLRPSTTTVHEGRLQAALARGFERLDQAYARGLDRLLRRPGTTVVVATLMFVVSLPLLMTIGTELMPESDEGRLDIDVELAIGTPLETTIATMTDLERRTRAVVDDAELDHLTTIAGPENWWRPAGSNQGSIQLMLVPRSERERSIEAIADAVRQVAANVPGADIRVRSESSNFLLRIMRGGGDDRLSVDVRGHDIATANELTDRVRLAIADIPGLTNIDVSREEGQLERTIVVDRERLGELGLGAADVAEAIEHYVLGSVATRFRDDGDEFDVRVVLDARDRERLEQLPALPIIGSTGVQVPLSAVARIEERLGPASIERENQQRLVRISMGLDGQRDLGQVVADIEEVLAGIPAPEGFSMTVGGEFREQQETFSRLLLGAVLAIFLVYAVMAVQFESLSGPFIVMTAVPFAFVGVVLTLFLTHTTLNMNSFLGVIVLVGVVVNNAIVLVDCANGLQRDAGMSLMAAVREAGRLRLRPILMTTATTVLGMMPLALAVGEGSELQAPLARVVVGGLLVSTVVTLALVPCLYLLLERRSTKTST